MSESKTVLRSYKLRFYPNDEQRAELKRFLDVKRFAWNKGLEMRNKAYERRNVTLNSNALSKTFTALKKTQAFAFLKAAPSSIVTQALRDLDTAFAHFFAKRAKYPKFKSKRHTHSSFRVQVDARCVGAYFIPGEKIRLPGMKNPLDGVRWSYQPKALPKMLTISVNPSGQWHVSFSVEESIEPHPMARQITGIDLGLKNSVITSQGAIFAALQPLRAMLYRLKKLQRRLKRKVKTSKRYAEAKYAIAKLHQRIVNVRKHALHTITSTLIHDNQMIGVEALNIAAMMKNGRLARAIADVSWGELLRQLDYKALWHDRVIKVIDRFMPSTQTCSCCNAKTGPKGLGGLSFRQWTCPECGTTHDRDINAAKNIERWPSPSDVSDQSMIREAWRLKPSAWCVK